MHSPTENLWKLREQETQNISMQLLEHADVYFSCT